MSPKKTAAVSMFTTADRGLDSYGSRELGVVGSSGARSVRQVVVEARSLEAQVARWGSGPAVVCDREEWAKRLARGLAVAA